MSNTITLHVPVLTMHYKDKLLYADVINPDQRDYMLPYPLWIDEEPSAENGWESRRVPTMNMLELRLALSPWSDEFVTQALGTLAMEKKQYIKLEGKPAYMPSIGHICVSINMHTLEIE